MHARRDVEEPGVDGRRSRFMFVIGCLLLLVLPLVGLALGSYIGGIDIGIWAALGGFGLAVLASAVSVAALLKASSRRR